MRDVIDRWTVGREWPKRRAAARTADRALANDRVLVAGVLLVTLMAVALFGVTLQHINLRAMTDIGLMSVLPRATLLAIAILTVGYYVTLLALPTRTWLLLLQVALLIVMLYGVTTFLEGTPRFGATWKHVGLTEYFIRGRPVDPHIDAYFSWPAFFTLNAFLFSAAGFHTPLNLVVWAPVVYNLIYLGPLLLIVRAFTGDSRLIWLSIWLFYVTNWIGQDYFSPQGLSYFSYLVILAVLLTWFRGTRQPGLLRASSSPPNTWRLRLRSAWTESHLEEVAASPRLRAGLVPIVVLIDGAIVASHQLTPIALLVAVTALVVFGRCSARWLPVLMGVLLTAWLGYMTESFLQGHLSLLTSDLGQLTNSVGSNVGSRVQGSPGHIFIVHLRLLMTVAIWGIAALGVLRRVRYGVWDVSCILLAGAPFVLLGLQSYGGEMALRVYFFSLPFMAFLAAALFLPVPRPPNFFLSLAAAGVVSLGLIVGFLFARYGNESMDYFPPDEVAAIQRLYQIAPHGSTFVTLGEPPNIPWRAAHYEQYQFTYIALQQPLPPGTKPTASPSGPSIDIQSHSGQAVVRSLAALMSREGGKRSYLVLTGSQIAITHLLAGVPADAFYRLERALATSDRFSLVVSNRDSWIYLLHSGKRTSNGV